MSYKPLSQTVTDGQKNPISSDAVFDAIAAVPQLPNQTSQSGKFLTTDGSSASWATVSAGANTALSNLSSVAINTALLGTLGTVSAPAYSFTGDTNTGMWSSAADTLNFSTNGSECLRITSAGFLGLNTASPESYLHVTLQNNVEILRHTYNANYIFRLRGEVAGSDYVYKFINRMDSTNYEAITFGRGILTIGSPNPNVNLNVNGTISATKEFRGPLGTTFSPTYSFTDDTNTGVWSSAADTLNLSTAGAERLRISSTGKVGINTTSPTADLHITNTGNPGSFIDLTFNSNWGFRFISNNDGTVVRYHQIFKGNGIDYNVLSFAGTGNVGINQTNPTEKLEVNGNIKGGTVLFNADSNRQATVANLGFLTATKTHDFGSIAHGAQEETTITVTGAAVGDAVFVGAPAAIEADLSWCAYVSAADTVTLRLQNVASSGNTNPASATWRVTVLKT